MCGILGWLGEKIDRSLAISMSERLKHRGPDNYGEWYEHGVWLAHCRLAILDLSSKGHQPMHSFCSRFVFTFNGQIYNYKELRLHLEKVGCSFQGESDSEVALMAISVWGVESAIQRFEGMFAFGLYDRVEKALWLGRDPMGIKPVYYTQLGEKFAFASEMTPLLLLPWIDRSIDQNALFYYFRYLCVPTQLCILKGIKKLAAGSLLKFSHGQTTIKTFWNLTEQVFAAKEVYQPMQLQEAVSELEARLRRSVCQHMQSDVPFGAFLSGGVDSSAVVALMQSESSKKVKTFSIGFLEDSHDESIHARAIAAYLGTDHHELILSVEDVPELVQKVAGFFDEPFADNSSIPTYLVSQFARKHVVVCLSGDGGDELFGGYPRYFWARRIEQLRAKMTPMGALLGSWFLRVIPEQFWDKFLDPILGYRFSGSEGLAHRVRRFAGYLSCTRKTSYSHMVAAWPCPSKLICYEADHLSELENPNYLNISWAEEMMLMDQSNYLQADILTKVDRASMAVSLEARVPLLIHPIVEFSWQLGASLNLGNAIDSGKLTLRNMLYRYVPRALIERPKQGFGMPIDRWLRGPLRDWAEDLLNPVGLEQCGLKVAEVTKGWQEHQAGLQRHAMLWAVLMYRQWYQRVISG